MDGVTAQTAAMVIAGNHYLKGGDISGFWPGSAVFKFCKSVNFIVLAGGPGAWQELPYADDPAAWFEKQRAEGTVGFRLIHMAKNAPTISDRESAGFVGGGGRKILEVVKTEDMDGWEAGWRVGDQKDPDQKIWRVTYGRFDTVPRRNIIPYNMTSMVHALSDALVDIAVFAKRQPETAGWVQVFETAMTRLKRKLPLSESGNFRDFEPYVADLRAQQLLAACEAAWVFGAMGSWNDITFEGETQKAYNDVSDKLFKLLLECTVTAVNSTFDPRD